MQISSKFNLSLVYCSDCISVMIIIKFKIPSELQINNLLIDSTYKR